MGELRYCVENKMWKAWHKDRPNRIGTGRTLGQARASLVMLEIREAKALKKLVANKRSCETDIVIVGLGEMDGNKKVNG